MFASGSMAVVAVEPRVATTAQGIRPAARSSAIIDARASGRMAKIASTGTSRTFSRPKPASNAALATELCAWLEA